MSKIANPHDKFFKEVFTDRENVMDFINGVFPTNIKKNINLETLELDNTVYIDAELEEYFSDIVYNCKYKGEKEIKISLLFEHKSYNVKYPHVQVLKYMLKIWETNIKQKENLIPVIPIVVYHGKEKWNNKEFHEYFENIDKNLKFFLPDYNYILADLSKYSDHDIKDKIFQRITLETAMLLLKNIFDENKLRDHLEDYLGISKIYFESESGLNFLKSLVKYIYNGSDLDVNEVTKSIKNISEKGGEVVMSTASRLIEMGELKGIEKGIEQGVEKAKREDAENMLSEGLDIRMISRITGLSVEVIESLVSN